MATFGRGKGGGMSPTLALAWQLQCEAGSRLMGVASDCDETPSGLSDSNQNECLAYGADGFSLADKSEPGSELTQRRRIPTKRRGGLSTCRFRRRNPRGEFLEMSSELDVEKLIEAVRVRPPLWNKVDPKYRNLEYTNGLWREVREEMGCSLADAELKQKWHNLRDCFRREVRFEHAGKKKRRWIYYNQMLFLLTPQFLHKFMRKNKIKEADTTEADEAEAGENEIVIPIKTETADGAFDFELNNGSDSNNSELGEGKRGCSESTEDDMSEEQCLTEPVAEGLVIPDISEGGEPSGYCGGPPGGDRRRAPPQGDPGRHSRTIKDDDYHFAMSIVPHMRQVPLHRKLKMRIKITEVIAEEYGYNKAPS